MQAYDHHIRLNSRGIQIYSADQMHIESTAGSLHSFAATWQIAESLTLQTDSAITIEADIVEIMCNDNCLKLTNEACIFSGENFVLQTNEIPNTTPCCQGDYQACPASTGSKPHVGSTITTGSHNVFINNKSVIRHGDHTTCHGESTQIISHHQSIRINGQPIAHGRSTTQHGGILKPSQKTLILNQTKNDNNNQSSELQNHQSLQINIRMFGDDAHSSLTSSITIQMDDHSRTISTHQKAAILSGLSLKDIENVSQIEIE